MLAALFHSGPIHPRHNRRASFTGELPAEEALDAEHRFFLDFDMFADRVNNLYTPSDVWDGGPWRLQELADTEISFFFDDPRDGPNFGLRYRVFYNQAAIGIVEISAAFDYDAEKEPKVSTLLKLEHVRLLPFEEVVGFLITLAQYLAWGEPDQFTMTQRDIDRALLAVVWNTNQNSDDDGIIKLHLSGSAQHYLKWRTLVLNNRARGA